MSHKKGFTLLEILLVVGIIAVLAGIVIIAINPGRQLATVRNTQRKLDLREINSALQQYYIDHNSYPPGSLPYGLLEICDTGSLSTSSVPAGFCGYFVNLSALVPTYLTAIPKDPQGSNLSLIPKAFASANGTGYEIGSDTDGKMMLVAPQAELNTVIAIASDISTEDESRYTITASGFTTYPDLNGTWTYAGRDLSFFKPYYAKGDYYLDWGGWYPVHSYVIDRSGNLLYARTPDSKNVGGTYSLYYYPHTAEGTITKQ